MSIIVWDGTDLAADRQGVDDGLAFETKKLFKFDNGVVMGFVGPIDTGYAMMEWVRGKHAWGKGVDVKEWPTKAQSSKKRSCEVIVGIHGKLYTYGRIAVMIPVLQQKMAWGSGRDIAIGAMARGATAKEAVQVTAQYHIDCGMGVDVFRVSCYE